MALEGYPTPQELRDASADTKTLEKFNNDAAGVSNINRAGIDVENLLTLRGRMLDEATALANMRTYLTRAAMDLDATQPEKTMAKVVLDPVPANNVQYVRSSGVWVEAAAQSLSRRDGLPYNGLIANGLSVNTVLAQGVYRGNANGGYLDLPLDFPVTSAFTLINTNQSAVVENSRFVLQSLRQFTTPWNIWTRLVDRNQIGFFPWEREGTATYRGIAPVSDLNNLVQSGKWIFAGAPLSRPPGAPESGLIEVVPFGTYYIQRLRDLNNPLLVWERINRTSPVTVGNWSKLFSKDRGVLTSANDFNALTAQDADYVLTTAPSNGPENGPPGGIYSTRVVGDWESAVLQSTLDPSQEWRRRRRLSTGAFYAWSKVGSPLSGRYVFVGDSITEFGDYPERVGSKLGISVLKVGFGACRMGKYTATTPTASHYDAMCMYRIADYISTGDYAPLIQAADDLFAASGDDNRQQALALSQENFDSASGLVIAFGTNDFGGNLPIGENSDSSGETFKGAINYIVGKIASKYPRLNIFFVSPLWRARFTPGDGMDADSTPNNLGSFLIEYVDALAEVAALNKIPSLDLYRNSGINKFNHSTFLGTDGLHPVDGVGYQRLADRIAAGLRATL